MSGLHSLVFVFKNHLNLKFFCLCREKLSLCFLGLCGPSIKYIFITSFLQVGVAVWPILQVINYTMVPEKNRIPFVSLCSLAWSSFLAYMNHCSKNEKISK